jgi:hypothetical protein
MQGLQELQELQIMRLQEGGVNLEEDELDAYLEAPDVIENPTAGSTDIPAGYKRCGKCKRIKKFYLFNRNKSARNNCTGNCKECQIVTAQKSYDKNKDKRDYKKYYAENREMKREHGRNYYQRNKEKILARQRQYKQTAAGKEVMNKARSTRKKSMKENAGIPYTREIVIDRDSRFINSEFPLCCLCNKPITDPEDIHMEHIISIAIGGADCFTNVGCAHSECNLSKSKDAAEITVEQVESIEARAEAYIDAHPEAFPHF